MLISPRMRCAASAMAAAVHAQYPDAYFFLSLHGAGASPLVGAFGVLDANGGALVEFNLFATGPALAGLELEHAALLLHPFLTTAILTSEPVSVKLVPWSSLATSAARLEPVDYVERFEVSLVGEER